MSTPQSWSGGGGRQADVSRRQADEVGWSRKVTEMGWGTDKGGKRQEREEGRLYHDTYPHLTPILMLVFEFQNAGFKHECWTQMFNPWNKDLKMSDSHIQPMELQL